MSRGQVADGPEAADGPGRATSSETGSPSNAPPQPGPSQYQELLARYRLLEKQRDILRALVQRYEQRFHDQQGRQSYRLARALSEAKRKPLRAWRIAVEALKLLVPWTIRHRVGQAIASSQRSLGRAEAQVQQSLEALLGGARSAEVRETVWPADQPLVSVIIPCFNYGEFVEQAVNSVLRQTLADVEVLVIEAGSTDETTRQKVQALEHPRLAKLFQPRPTSLGQNRLDGLHQVRGKYVAFLDADDMLAPTYLEKGLLALELTGADLAYPSVQLFGNQEGVWESAPEFTLENLVREITIPGVAMFSIETWRRLELGYGTHIRAVEDWDFWLRFAARGAQGRKIREPLMLYRKHGTSMSEEFQHEKEEQKDQVLASHGSMLAPIRVARVSQQQRAARRVSNPLDNLRRVRRAWTAPLRVAVAAPSADHAGPQRWLLEALVERSRAQNAQVLVFTTDGPTAALGADGAELRSLTEDVFELPNFLDRRLFSLAVQYLLRSRDIQILLLLGGEEIYDLLPELDRECPTVRMVDHLDDPASNLERNRRYAAHLDFNIVSGEDVREVLKREGEGDERIATIGAAVDPSVRLPEGSPGRLNDRLSTLVPQYFALFRRLLGPSTG